MVVCCKSDTAMLLEKDYDSRTPLFEFIQLHFRQVSLPFLYFLLCKYLRDYFQFIFVDTRKDMPEIWRFSCVYFSEEGHQH